MIDFHPVVNILGRLTFCLGVLMYLPAALDHAQGDRNAAAFATAATLVWAVGAMVTLATRGALRRAFDLRSAFLLTVAIWVLSPLIGALPLMIGAPHLEFTDAYFEAVSGITTTGSTVIVGLSDLPAGMNLWRGMLNWLGGLGIAFIAMIFLPVMRVGGMQFFRTEGFDTLGKILPRASDIALSLIWVYAGLTLACLMAYKAIGMSALDSAIHAFSTIATGGFSAQDSSFGAYGGSAEYVGALFMVLSAIPYIRYVQLVSTRSGAIWRDVQVHGFLRWILLSVGMVTLWRWWQGGQGLEEAFRQSLFNLISIMTGTGVFSTDISHWGGFALVVAFVVGIIGGCSGSSSAALSVFRVQLAMAAVRAHLRQVSLPHRVEPVRYAGRAVDEATLSGVMTFVTGYILLMGVFSVAIALSGLDMQSAIFASWSSLGNIGFGIGPAIAATGTYADFPPSAKWIMILAMLIGRLSLLAVFVVLMPRFWRG